MCLCDDAAWVFPVSLLYAERTLQAAGPTDARPARPRFPPIPNPTPRGIECCHSPGIVALARTARSEDPPPCSLAAASYVFTAVEMSPATQGKAEESTAAGRVEARSAALLARHLPTGRRCFLINSTAASVRPPLSSM